MKPHGPYKLLGQAPNIGAWVLVAIAALAPLVLVHRIHPNLPGPALAVVYGLSVVILAFFWHVYFAWPKELDRRIPISSKELRRRKKEFYDQLGR
jgi:hypothetical protein